MRRREPRVGWQRGIVLITTLAIVVFLVMLSSMLITTAYTSLRSSTSLYDSDRSYQAAMAGISFVQASLQDNISFMAYGTGYNNLPSRTDSTGNFTVTSSNGLITGTDYTSQTQFRVCFNNTLDSDTTGCEYTSVNHMSGVNADQDGSLSPLFPPYTLDKGNAYEAVQKRTCTVIAEGFTLNPGSTNINYYSRRAVEANFYRDMTGILNSVVQAGGNLQITAANNGNVLINEASGVAGMPNVRTLGNMVVNATAMANYSDLVGDVMLDTGNTAKLNGTTALPQTNASESQAQNASNFLPVTYTQATQQYAGYGSSTVNGGAYCFWSGQTNTPSYYPDLVYDRSQLLPDGSQRYTYLFDSSGVWSQTQGISWDGGVHPNTVVQIDYSFTPPIATAFPPAAAYPPSNNPSFTYQPNVPGHPEYNWQMNVNSVVQTGPAYNPTEGANNSFAVLTAGYDPNTGFMNTNNQRIDVNFAASGSAPAALLNPSDAIACAET